MNEEAILPLIHLLRHTHQYHAIAAYTVASEHIPYHHRPSRCTVDAMQLRNEHFYSYIPRLMGRVGLYLNPPVSHTSKSSQMPHDIDN